MGTIVGYWVVNSFVESVVNTKLPDLLVVMERVRARYLARFDAVLFMLEREILQDVGLDPDLGFLGMAGQ